MKFLVLIAAICCISACSAQSSIGIDFLTDNVLNPMIDQIYNNAISMLGQQLTSLLSGLFGTPGKRAVTDVVNLNIAPALASFIAKIKEVYQRLFKVFVQIIQNVQEWIEKPDWARIEFVRAGAEAEMEVANLDLGFDFLKPLVGFVQQHLGVFIDQFQVIIAQLLDAAKHPVQSLIGSGSLLQP